MNLIGKTTNLINGNRTAEIALGSENDDSFLKLKDYNIN